MEFQGKNNPISFTKTISGCICYKYNSVLAEEIARDIQMRCAVVSDNADSDYLNWALRVLTVTLCSRESLSCAQQTELGQGFIDLLLRMLMDSSASTAVVHLILALYRQFQASCNDYNPVHACLSRREMCEILVEKMILLYNREGKNFFNYFESAFNETFYLRSDDPLGDFTSPGDKTQSNSVSLLMLGLFSKVETARLFYTADLEVVVDIIQRR